MDQDLGVALRAERVPPGLEPVPQRGEVVDLAVEDRPDRAVLVRERLMAPGQVDDRQPAETRARRGRRGRCPRRRARGGRGGPSSPPGVVVQAGGVGPGCAADSAHRISSRKAWPGVARLRPGGSAGIGKGSATSSIVTAFVRSRQAGRPARSPHEPFFPDGLPDLGPTPDMEGPPTIAFFVDAENNHARAANHPLWTSTTCSNVLLQTVGDDVPPAVGGLRLPQNPPRGISVVQGVHG